MLILLEQGSEIKKNCLPCAIVNLARQILFCTMGTKAEVEENFQVKSPVFEFEKAFLEIPSNRSNIR